MKPSRLCSLHVGSVGVIALLFYFIDYSIASLDGYIPGEDYPAYEEVPTGLAFTCDDKIPGYYADPETQCQVWHWCVPTIGGNIQYSFLCNAGTVFNQRTRVCDWFFNVDCPSAPAFYGINEDLYKDEAGNLIAGKKTYKIDSTYDNRRLLARRNHNLQHNNKISTIITTTDKRQQKHRKNCNKKL